MENKRVVWITGAGKGIGKALTEIFLKNDEIVIATSRNIEKIQEMDFATGVLDAKVCNIIDENNIKDTIEFIKNKYGRIDILINNAGIGIYKEIVNTSVDDFVSQFNTNLLGTFLASKYVIPLMIDQKRGQIFNIISVAAIKAFPHSGTYGATKAGALMLSKVMREELKKFNIKVISVIPGATKTDIWSQKIKEKYGELMMTPEDIAKSILNISLQSDSIITEELILRPMNGDL